MLNGIIEDKKNLKKEEKMGENLQRNTWWE